MSFVELEDVRKTISGNEILRGVTLGVEDGEFVVLIGPSGAGKSTILRAIAGLESIQAGRITVGGRAFSDPARHVSLSPDRRELGLVFQSYALWPHLDVVGNIAYPLKARRIPAKKIPGLVSNALDQVGLGDFRDRKIQELSGGQQQRVALARAIVSQPSVLLLDEPLSNLDAKLRVQLRDEIRRVHNELGRTTIHVTHDQAEALALADRIVVLRDGAVQQVGTPIEVYESPQSRFVAEFFGFANFFEGEVLESSGQTVVVRSPDWYEPVVAGRGSHAGLGPGERVLVAVKKAGISLLPIGSSDAPENRAVAVVVSNQFQGELRDYRLQREDGAQIVVRTPTSVDYTPGTRVVLQLKPGEAVIVERGTAQERERG